MTISNPFKPNEIRDSGMTRFMLLWIGQVISLIGSGMTCFAQSVWVYTDAGGTITHLSLLALSAALPGVLIAPLAGAVADRYNKKMIMIIADTMAAFAALTLRTLIVMDIYKIWHIYIIVMVISVANQFQWPAYFSSVSLLVPKKQLGFANGMIQLSRSLGMIAAPFMAGVAVTLFKIQGVILFDFASFLISMVILLIIKIPQPERRINVVSEKPSLLKEAAFGWKYLLSKRGLFGLLILFASSNFMIGFANILFIPLVLSMTTTIGLGSVMGISALGMVIGSIIMSAWGGPKKAVNGVFFFMILQGAAVIAGGAYPSITLLIIAAITFYFSIPMVNGMSNLIWHRKVAPDVQGRVIAAASMVTASAPHITSVLSGPLADNVFEPMMTKGGGTVGKVIGVGEGRGIALMYVLIGLICIVTAVIGLLNPRVRRIEEELPDEIDNFGGKRNSVSGQHEIKDISALGIE